MDGTGQIMTKHALHPSDTAKQTMTKEEDKVVCVAYSYSGEDTHQEPENGGNVRFKVELMGPNKNRVMTDKICLIIFAVALLLWMVLGIYGCVRLFIIRSASKSPDEQIINITEIYLKDGNLSKININYISEEQNGNLSGNISHDAANHSQWYYYSQLAGLAISDLKEAKYVIGGSMLCTAVVSITYVLFLYWAAEIISWISFILFGIPILSGLVYCCLMAFSRGSLTPINELDISPRTIWLILSGIVLVIFIVYVLLVFKNIAKIKQGISIIKESSRVVGSKMASVLIAASTWLLHILTILTMATVAASMEGGEFHVFSGGNGTCSCRASYNNIIMGAACEVLLTAQLCKDCTGACVTVLSNLPVLKFLQAYNLIVFTWLTAFLVHLSYTILGGSFAFTYFTEEEHMFRTSSNILFPIRKIFRYHLGTLALGALVTLLAGFVKIIQLASPHTVINRVLDCIFKHQKHKMKKKISHPWFRIWMAKDLLMICKHAYITTLVFGTPFRDSAIRVLTVRKSNILGVSKTAKCILFLAQLGICIIVTTRSYHFINNFGIRQNFQGLVPTIVIFVMALLISTVGFRVCTIAAEIIIIAFLEDEKDKSDATKRTSCRIPFKLAKSLSQKQKTKTAVGNPGLQSGEE